ncbi:Pentatricopeptide repeat-containing protein [Abeliophyllum distichum]|uniref:Pentatricopeptide repeat-containing protein n=1 Tax=Abeliophyllum distichum TaxID=126358 RepID=A0ABD1Q2E8_9LAMI
MILAVWNSIIQHYSLGSFPDEVIFHYLSSNSVKVGFDYHVYVQTAVVNMYVDCGSFVEAKKVFDEMPERNLVTWNVLITGFYGYMRMNQFNEALALFRRMVVHDGIKPTEVTLLAIYPAIWNIKCLEFCQMVRAYRDKSGLNAFDIRVMNCLIDAYAKCGSIESTQRFFEDILDERENLVSWTSMISGFATHGMAKEACGGLVDKGLEFFRKIVDKSGIAPDIKNYGSLIDMLGRAWTLEEAEKMASEIPVEIGTVEVAATL